MSILCFFQRIGLMLVSSVVTSPMVNFTHAKDTLLRHGSQLSHKTAMDDAATFCGLMNKGQLNVLQHLEKEAIAKVRN